MDLNSAKVHFCSKFGNCNFDWWLCHAQAQNGVNFDFVVQFDLEGDDQSSHKTKGILTKVFYLSGPNFVILA